MHEGWVTSIRRSVKWRGILLLNSTSFSILAVDGGKDVGAYDTAHLKSLFSVRIFL